MLASIFSKTRPFNYLVVGILSLFFFSIKIIALAQPNADWIYYAEEFGLYVLLFSSLFILNFITLKNGLTKGNNYALLLFFVFLLFFSSIFQNKNIIISNFLLLLALRRLISLKSLLQTKEKIFDASMWIFIASLFHFWCILFVLLVYISIIFHVSRDYRNWLLPFVAFVATAVVFLFAALLIDKSWIDHIVLQSQMHLEWNYFTNNLQNAALSFYVVVALYFLLSMVFTLTNRPLILQASYKKMVFGFLIGSIVFILSPDKNNAMLFFTFFPLAVMTTNNIEYSQNKMYQEIVLLLLTVGSFTAFFAQL